MKKVAIISYNFPPVGGAGVQRPVKFVKYLREFGWEPVVLSVANPSVPVRDESLLKDIPDDVKVYRATTLEPSYPVKKSLSRKENCFLSNILSLFKQYVTQLLLPDVQILWWPGLILKLVKIIAKEKPNVLFVSAPPFSSFVPVIAIANVYRIPCVLDYRDEWLFTRDNWENSIKTSFAKKLDHILEGYVLKKCFKYVAANQSYIDSIMNKYTEISVYKGAVVTNGYDDDDFEKITNIPNNKDKIVITYTGTLWKATSLRNFITALNLFYEKYNISNNKLPDLCINIFGRIVEEEKKCIDQCDKKEIISVYGYIDHEKILNETCNSDVLLLTLSDLPGAEKIITGKIFEYMATGKHILALLPEGETKSILMDNYNNATIVEPNECDKICSALEYICMNIDHIRYMKKKDVSQFSRKKLTKKLADIFDSVYLPGQGYKIFRL